MYNYNKGVPFNYTGKLYGDYGKFFTLSIWEEGKQSYCQSAPFVQVDGFPKTITFEMFKHFLNNRAKEWIDFFGEDIVKKNLKYISPDNFLQITFCEDGYDRESPYYYGNLNYFYNQLHWLRGWVYGKRTTYPCVQEKGRWERPYTGRGYMVLHLSHYDTWEKKFMEHCLISKFPYLKEFEFDAYGFHLKNSEMYIKVNGSNPGNLYVPLKALSEKDFSFVVTRMTTYFSWYYNTNKEKLEKSLALLESDEAMKLKQILEG